MTKDELIDAIAARFRTSGYFRGCGRACRDSIKMGLSVTYGMWTDDQILGVLDTWIGMYGEYLKIHNVRHQHHTSQVVNWFFNWLKQQNRIPPSPDPDSKGAANAS